jgi:Zn-dependent protease
MELPPDFLSRIILFFPIFLFALTVHEVAHALTANWGGDLTATYQNRLSLNPMIHIDPFGTVMVPLFSMLYGFAMFGWARPVPVNEASFRDKAWNVVVSLAGPFSNLLLIIFGSLLYSLAMRIALIGSGAGWWTIDSALFSGFTQFIFVFVMLNWVLILFNLIPIPPLDGSHVLFHFFVRGRGWLYEAWDMYARVGLIFLLMLFWLTPLRKVFGEILFGLTHFSLNLLGVPPFGNIGLH